MTKNRFISQIIVSGYLLVLLIALFMMMSRPDVVSSLISLSFFWLALVFVLTYKQLRQGKIITFVCAVLCVINVYISVLTNVTIIGSSFNYYKKVIMFISALLWMLICSNYTVDKRVVQYITYINIVLSFLFFVFARNGTEFYEGEVLLSLNFSNPNQTGMFILNVILYLLCSIPLLARAKFNKVLIPLFVLYNLALVYLLYRTGSRASLSAIVFFLFCLLADGFLKKHKAFRKGLCLIWSLFPLLFCIYYVFVIGGNFGFDTSLGIEGHGKFSDTRMMIWRPAFDSFNNSVLVGDYYGISGGTGISQLHNTHLDVLVSYGITPFILFVFLLFFQTYRLFEKAPSIVNRMGIYAFMACFISGVFEASLVSGSAGLYILSFGFLLFARSNSAL